MTFSIVARCPRTNQFAVSVCSSSPAVGARCAFARAGVGAATTQNITDPRLGPQLLTVLQQGAGAHEARNVVIKGCEYSEFRQLTVVDNTGRTSVWSGGETLGIHASAEAPNVASAGNLLKNTRVPEAIVDAFVRSDGERELGERVITAMQAGLRAGGEAGPVHSAALLVVHEQQWPLVDLRVDWVDEGEPGPVDALERLWTVWKPQMHEYVTRGLHPDTAPAYGVPGDE